MTRLFSIWLGCLFAVGALAQQVPVNVEVISDQNEFLPGEPLVVGVRITNLSGQPLIFGRDNEWLSFFIEGMDNITVSMLGQAPVKGEFEVESSTRATRRVDLAPYYGLNQSGTYRITATVKIREWNQELKSEPKTIHLVKGTTLWEQEFGVPGTGAGGPPEIRKYLLQQARFLNNQMRLYVRLTDAYESKVFRMIPIAQMVSFSRPEVQLDRSNNLHVLHQTYARSFNYCIINPQGTIVIRHRYDYSDYNGSRPVLGADEQGRIVVRGGVRRVTASDIPPPETEAAAPDKTETTP